MKLTIKQKYIMLIALMVIGLATFMAIILLLVK